MIAVAQWRARGSGAQTSVLADPTKKAIRDRSQNGYTLQDLEPFASFSPASGFGGFLPYFASYWAANLASSSG